MKAVKTNFKDRVAVKRHKELVQIIKENWPIFNKSRFAIGNALIELHDGGYWKSTHTSFSDYCEETFGISDNYARRLMDAAKTQSELPEEWQSSVKNERQARALSDAPKSDRVEVLKEASKNGHITEKSIREATAKVEERGRVQNVPMGTDRVSVKPESKPEPAAKKEKPSVILDCIQTPIPDEALPYWKLRDEVQGILTQIVNTKRAFKRAAKGDHPLYSRVYQNALDYLSRAYHVIADCKPYTLCTRCMGSPSLQPEGCSFCASTGVISEIRWKNNADPRVKQMRMLSNADYAKSHNLPPPTEQPEELEEV